MQRRRQAAEQGRVGLQRVERAADQVVEVERRRSPRRPPRTSTNARASGPAAGSAATSAALTPRSSLSREKAVSSRPDSAAVVPGHSSAMIAARSTSGSTARPASRRISRPSAWNVRTRTVRGPTPSGATAASSRSPSSSAARLLNVMAAIVSGAAPPSISQAIRATRVVVLPDPAGATHRTGPGWRGRRGALVGREASEAIGDRCRGRHGRKHARGGSPRHQRCTRAPLRWGSVRFWR